MLTFAAGDRRAAEAALTDTFFFFRCALQAAVEEACEREQQAVEELQAALTDMSKHQYAAHVLAGAF
jgi:hypothetical protein